MRKRLGLAGIAGSIAVALLLLITGSVSDLVGAATFLFSAGFRRWVQENSLLVFWAGVTLVVVLTVYVLVLHRMVTDGKKRESKLIQTHQGELAERDERLESVAADLKKSQTELAELRAEPTPHDCDLFQRFLDDFPQDRGTVEYLTKWFSGESWDIDRFGELYEFCATWSLNTFFDDEEVQAALTALQEKCTDFRVGVASESFRDLGDPDDGTRVLKRDRFESNRQFKAKARELEGLADRLLEAHNSLVKIGRSKRLYRSRPGKNGPPS
ncbi:hypothetical protein O7600_23315 [Micromonospora sp. WMMA1998]|uniref:hypothetical protein n=1 Tax=Micromonospora sp. WMMA1998 TaxID=3015167 RepID=UPI00248C0B36|nr:hypothetical protein [Micromonospora sp. WMMA1998]WBC14015.1 hypothetical protein O7600_23315 [Micromonospora sp. WMMA1998]